MQYKATGGTIRNTTVADSFGAIPSSDYVAVAANVTVENSAFQCPPVNGSTELNASVHFASGGDCWIEADKVVGLAPLVVRFKAHCEGAASYDWHFGAGATPSTSTLAEPEVTFADTGNHLVTLTCGTRSAQLEISVRAAVAYAATDGAAIYPYDTQAKAATSLQDALDAVYADDSVLGTVNVGAGTWKYTGSDVSGSFTPWLLVNKPVKVVGPADGEALFDADRRIMTLFLFHPRAVLERLTISNGRLNQNGPLYGGSLHMMEGLVTNCVISKGYCNYGGNATIRGGSVWNSQFLQGTLNQSGEDRAGGGLQLHGGATVANSIFANNTGGYGGGFSIHHGSAIVSNCVIRNNSGGGCCGAGVGLANGLVTHCVITNNTSSNGGVARVSGGTLRNCSSPTTGLTAPGSENRFRRGWRRRYRHQRRYRRELHHCTTPLLRQRVATSSIRRVAQYGTASSSARTTWPSMMSISMRRVAVRRRTPFSARPSPERAILSPTIPSWLPRRVATSRSCTARRASTRAW